MTTTAAKKNEQINEIECHPVPKQNATHHRIPTQSELLSLCSTRDQQHYPTTNQHQQQQQYTHWGWYCVQGCHRSSLPIGRCAVTSCLMGQKQTAAPEDSTHNADAVNASTYEGGWKNYHHHFWTNSNNNVPLVHASKPFTRMVDSSGWSFIVNVISGEVIMLLFRRWEYSFVHCSAHNAHFHNSQTTTNKYRPRLQG